MILTFAPMEGMTDGIYRQVHHQLFGGVDAYYLPFVSPTQNLEWHTREMRNLSPEVNAGLPVIPQVLCKEPALFLWAAKSFQEMGYTEVNLNLGCPSGTVTSKGKGSGMLKDPDTLRAFLDSIFAQSPLPISIKTRIGFSSSEEWLYLLKLFTQYPIHELIIHARVREQFYTGEPDVGAYEAALSAAPFPVMYNGNLFTVEEITRMTQNDADARLMLGRGLYTNPALAREARGQGKLEKHELIGFQETLYARYLEVYPKNVVLGKMREISKYLSWCLADADRDRKKMLKAKTLPDYLSAVHMLFESHGLKAVPAYERPQENQPWP